jgi:trans-AT polyketide synthase/acyltransferase/oxidoreductase domain-containing protein
MSQTLIQTNTSQPIPGLTWQGAAPSPAVSDQDLRARLLRLDEPAWVVVKDGQAVLVGEPSGSGSVLPVLAYLPPLPVTSLGDPSFKSDYGLTTALYGGAMANAIASEAMVIALGKAGMLGSFGSAGLLAARIEAAIARVKEALPNGPYMFNLINSPYEPAMEQRAVDVFLKHDIHLVEASAYLDITANLAYYRAAGLVQAPDGSIEIRNHVIAKVSRKEVARRFLEPAPQDILTRLVNEGKITPQQAEMARQVPVADDITVEADSGGHTDNRPLVGLVPTLLTYRDEMQAKHGFKKVVRIGAAGGIGTPGAALAAFMMGAAYVVTGSVNQACVESDASEHTRSLLASIGMADVTMAPAADMFEMGVRVQVVKRGTMFAMRASKMYELYQKYPSIEAIPADELDKLEQQVFKRKVGEIWQDTVKFFTERDPRQIERAEQDPHQKMALIFRWYLGLSSRWSNTGEKGREMDYQVWCGPAMGTFNDWVRGSYLEQPANRHVVDVNLHILTGAAYLYRLRLLEATGLRVSAGVAAYKPGH